MGNWGKWIGGGLGWAMLGPLGGILGFILGSVIDGAQQQDTTAPPRTTQGDFSVSLLVLLAAVMKADGKVVKAELEYVKKFLVASFGRNNAQEMLLGTIQPVSRALLVHHLP